MIIATVYEKKSKYGNTYFYGEFEDGGGSFILLRVKSKKSKFGEPVWELCLTEKVLAK